MQAKIFLDDVTKPIEPCRTVKRYSPESVNCLSRINASLAQIKMAPIWPASAESLRFSAQVGTIHYSTLIEGNKLDIIHAQRAVKHQLPAQTKAELELVNYVKALEFIDEMKQSNNVQFTEEFILSLHARVMKSLGSSEDHFKPFHEGSWRNGEAVVYDPIQGIVHHGSPQQEVRSRMIGLLEWINKAESDIIEWPVPVIAGIIHFNIAEVHPFADGNGRMARLLTAAFLARHNLTPGQMFNFDAYYGKDKDSYVAALRSFKAQTHSLNTWIEYFLQGLASEFERVAALIEELNVVSSSAESHFQFTKTQQRALNAFTLSGKKEFTRLEYEREAGVKRSTAAEELKRLVVANVLVSIGAGPQQRYKFANASDNLTPKNSHSRKWTEERIETELRELVARSGAFPTIAEFDNAGLRSLYMAIRRYGGIKYWASKINDSQV